jgi:hypothetical protein
MVLEEVLPLILVNCSLVMHVVPAPEKDVNVVFQDLVLEMEKGY